MYRKCQSNVLVSAVRLHNHQIRVEDVHFDEDSFRWLSQFNTKDTLNALGGSQQIVVHHFLVFHQIVLSSHCPDAQAHFLFFRHFDVRIQVSVFLRINESKVTKAIHQFSMEELFQLKKLYQELDDPKERIGKLKLFFSNKTQGKSPYGWKLYENVRLLSSVLRLNHSSCRSDRSALLPWLPV